MTDCSITESFNLGKRAISWRLAVIAEKVRTVTVLGRAIGYAVKGRANLGSCPICECKTVFIKEDEWLRDHYRCLWCHSIPRWRAIIQILNMLFPQWRELRILESSPGGSSSDKIRRDCKEYVPTHFFSDVSSGEYKNGVRCENLEKMTFDSESFDLVVTQDVFEHVLNPDKAFREVSRALKPGGAHVFTVPFYSSNKTVIRAVDSAQGIEYLEEKVYHGNPISADGSLVVTDWGQDLPDFIYRNSGMTTTIYQLRDPKLGLAGEFLEVFVSRK
jgi:hypothetical protein